MTAEVSRTDRAARDIAAPPAALWAAWADPERLVRWLPPPGATGEVLDWDFRDGGVFCLRLTFAADAGKTTADTDLITGRFVALSPPGHLAHAGEFASDDPAFAGTMRLDWRFDPAPGGSRASIEATGVPPGIDQGVHEAALAASLDQLAEDVARAARDT